MQELMVAIDKSPPEARSEQEETPQPENEACKSFAWRKRRAVATGDTDTPRFHSERLSAAAADLSRLPATSEPALGTPLPLPGSGLSVPPPPPGAWDSVAASARGLVQPTKEIAAAATIRKRWERISG